jgi:DNA polymerase
VGAAGKLLDELLGMVGWQRGDVYITNVVKCRPPNNRDPEPDEIAACQPYLRRQLEALDPALLVTLGRFSLQTFMPGDRISRVHGTSRAVDPASGASAATGYAMYHPAAALRQGALKETMQRDMAALPEVLIRARADRAAVTADPAEPAIPPPATPPSDAASRGPTTAPDDAPSASPPPSAKTSPPAAPAAAPIEDDEMKNPEDQLGLF